MPSEASCEQPKKKPRLAKSCEQCRNRKVRCDLRFPCGPCLKSRDRLNCAYRNNPGDLVVPRTDPPPNEHTAPVPPPNPPVLYNEGTFGGSTGRGEDHGFAPPAITGATAAPLSNGPGHAVTRPQVSLGDKPLTSQSELILRLAERIRRLEDQAASSRLVPSGETDATDGLRVQPTTPRLRCTQDKVRMFGETHWVHTAEKVFNFASFDADVEPDLGQHRVDMTKTWKELRSLRYSLKAKQQAEAPIDPSDLSLFPPRNVCDTLTTHYLQKFDRMYRILIIPKLREQTNQFWRDSQSVPKSFAMKYVLILATGMPFASFAGCMDQSTRQARQWIHTAQLWLATNEKSTINLQGLQIFCLLVIARQVNGLGPSPYFSAAALLSLAVRMGLHRDKDFFPNLSRAQAEFMARLWSTVVELALVSSLEDGTVPLVQLTQCDVKRPLDMDDSEMTDEPVHGQSYSLGDRVTDTTIQLVLLQSQQLRIRVLEVVNRTGPRASYNTIVDLTNQVRKACAEVSAFFASHSKVLGPDADFNQKYLDMYLRKHILLLHRPFMLEARQDPRFYLSRKICLETSMIMASYTDELNLPSPNMSDFSSLMVHGSGHLRGGLSLDVIITLAFEVNAQLQEEESTLGPLSGDPAQQLAQQARQPITRRLEHIRTQLYEIIAKGNPTLKRFGITSALLAQIKALEAGENVKNAFFDAIKDVLQKCTETLQAYMASHEALALSSTQLSPPTFDNFDFDLGDTVCLLHVLSGSLENFFYTQI
ncbi:hypothetical protein M406DRAFT_93912 [Cryphonectria parasitica EP155]|uniref:Zn(2)-C6 fungal-type domain-containing protein n=1 Tax=Cryphonectria parasitica (strain ATCC 38755 / EP155) TaxID=660469 RepID=A0A9P5CKK2_CRYP1|nr:uncharacterized protein M406DRAFT_93912 [Cryphonectria parasitica EP155]KAF3761061.1 hypothetical protein M406DRAFT_93912 [Cryphonectria parasitica EP155]